VALARRVSIAQNRVHGAFKVGRFWVIPLVNGLPDIRECQRGPKPTWKQLKRKAAITHIHINSHLFGKKDSAGKYVPVITVKGRGGTNKYCVGDSHSLRESRIVIPGPCTVVYNYENNYAGARSWIETSEEPIFMGKTYTYTEVMSQVVN
jgi:hypothetical protein